MTMTLASGVCCVTAFRGLGSGGGLGSRLPLMKAFTCGSLHIRLNCKAPLTQLVDFTKLYPCNQGSYHLCHLARGARQ